MRPSRFLLGCAAISLGVVTVAGSCTPSQRAAIPPAERALCVLLRALSPSLDEVCATADELAPFVPEILEARRASDAGAATSSLLVAFRMPAPSPSVRMRRRCEVWAPLDAGAGEAWAEAGPRARGPLDPW